jgi:hypothetical protein
MNASRLFLMLSIVALFSAAHFAIAADTEDATVFRLISAENDESADGDSGTAVAKSEAGGCNFDCYDPCECQKWTISADYLIMDRIGSKSYTLVSSIPTGQTGSSPTERLNANDFKMGFSSGPSLSVIRRGYCGYDFEAVFFQIDGWSNTRTISPGTSDTLYFTPEGTTTTSTDYDMQFKYKSQLYNGEFNVRWKPWDRITMLTGFRWLELRESLDGSLLESIGTPLWNTITRNNLYGFQIGADTDTWSRGCLSISGIVKSGIYCNNAEQTSTSTVGEASDSTNHTAFVGELGLHARYQISRHLSFRGGYQALWIEGVSLAPAQLNACNTYTGDTGIDSKGGVFYHGANAGFEFAF